ncbi:MAG: zinc-dependent alcohol dehydrogenase family protein [Selenomonadaceae bacterium]|nr:zinc-dependent alcohol dehydrogenase family protein [Selenomonadaceae bacterium]
MKAAVYHGKNDIRVEDVPVREICDDEVLIRVAYCGVCGTDVHIYNAEGGAFAVTPPLIPGHEFSGIVEKIGAGVKNVQVGDHVSGDPNIMCGKCYFCRNKMEHFCTNNIGVGTTVDGGFAEYVAMKASHVFAVPKNVDLLYAAMSEPVSCCVHGIDLCNIKAGDTVLVMGGGPIGMIAVQLAKISGAAKVILSEPVEEKRALALKLGADLTVNPIEQNLDEFLAGVTRNVNCVIECVGNTRTQEDAIRVAGKGATVMFFGLVGPDAEIKIKPDVIFKKELHVTSSFINPYTFYRAVELIASGRLNFDGIITNVVPLEELPEVLSNPEYRRKGKVVVKL